MAPKASADNQWIGVRNRKTEILFRLLLVRPTGDIAVFLIVSIDL
jgi:hypothetical protein